MDISAQLRNKLHKNLEEPIINKDGSNLVSAKNMHQFSISRVYSNKPENDVRNCLIGIGATLANTGRPDNFITLNEAIDKLAKLLNALGCRMRFHEWVLPRNAVEFAASYRSYNVIVRYLIDYIPNSDELYERWDVMVEILD